MTSSKGFRISFVHSFGGRSQLGSLGLLSDACIQVTKHGGVLGAYLR